MREVSPAKQWSRAIELSRTLKIYRDYDHVSHLIFHVYVRQDSVAKKVELWPEEEDWACDCSRLEDPCVHALATIILLKTRLEKKEGIESVKKNISKVLYCFTRKEGYLFFNRVLSLGEKRVFKLTSSLMALASGRVQGPSIVPTKEDLTIDLFLKNFQSGLIPQAFMEKLLRELKICEKILLDGVPVNVSSEPTGFIARVEDAPGGGVRLYCLQDPQIKESFRNGAVLCETKTLKPYHQGSLLPQEIKILAEGKYFSEKDFPKLVSEWIPTLEKKIKVQIQSTRLPQVVKIKPRLLIEAKNKGGDLELSPQIVYGENPWMARIVDGEWELFSKDIVPIRDMKEEKQLSETLEREFGPCSKQLCSGEEAAFYLESLKASFKGEIVGEALKGFEKHAALEPSFFLESREKDFHLNVSFRNSQEKTVHTKDLLKAWKLGQQMVPLLEGGYAPIPREWLEQYGDVLSDLLLYQEKSEKLHPSMYSDALDLYESLGLESPKELVFKKEELEKAYSKSSSKDIVSRVEADLRPYQKDAVSWLSFLKSQKLGALLADDMGLGKTLQSICILEDHSLVVAPTSVVYNWEKEIKRFRPSLSVSVYHGSKRSLSQSADVIITTYALLRIDEEKFLKKHWSVLVLDEAQNIKNPNSQVSKVVYGLSADFRLTLTGTPIENSLEDVWSQFHFLNPGILGSRKNFTDKYLKPIMQGDERVSVRLKRRLQPFIMRRMKSEVAKELPPRSDTVLYCELDARERHLYQSLLQGSRMQVEESLQSGKNILQVLELLLRLRQAACHRALIPGQEAESSSKVERLLVGLKESVSEGHKALVFSQWTSLLDLIEKKLKESSLKYARIDGSTSNRSEIVERFQNDGDIPILLLSLKAAGTGLNLTAADHVFITDPWWNPAVEEQAADRAYRIGQDKPVMVYRLVAKDTVEEKILLLKERKKALALSVVGSKATSFDREELLSLLDSGD